MISFPDDQRLPWMSNESYGELLAALRKDLQLDLSTDALPKTLTLALLDLAPNRPTIVGAKGGNVALANLLTALATLGLIIDNTT